MSFDVLIKTSKYTIRPIVLDGVTWETERLGTPSKLTFTVVKDKTLGELEGFAEGDEVYLYVNNVWVFKGFIFEKSRDKEHHIQVTAYDQLRYFVNKETYQYTNKRADEVLKIMADKFRLNTGTIDNTGFKIGARDEDNQTIFDIVLNALDLTYDATGKDYVLYDYCGFLMLQDKESLKVDTLIEAGTAENFDYTTSIDRDTFNYVKIRQETDDAKVRNVYIVEDSTLQGKWGILRFVLDVDKNSNAVNLANTIINLKGRKTHDLRIQGVKGDINVRAGFMVPVTLDVGDVVHQNKWMQCESVTHNIYADNHTMDITMLDTTTRDSSNKLTVNKNNE